MAWPTDVTPGVDGEASASQGRAAASGRDPASIPEGLLDAVGAVPWEAEPHPWRFTWVEGRAVAWLGYPLEQWYEPDFWMRRILPEDRERVVRNGTEGRSPGLHAGMEYRVRAADGRIVWVRHIAMAEPDPPRPGRVRGVLIDVTGQREVEQRFQREKELADGIIENLRRRLELENAHLRQEAGYRPEEIVGDSASMQRVLSQVEQVAATSSTVLILGETGVGKELVARAIHRRSPRRDRTLVTVNCAALPTALVESELFGRERGAYTGALTRQAGRFEIADGSTLFLDEVGELPVELQAKLLRVLEDGEFQRLGSARTIKVDVRVIAATNRDLARDVRARRFREDLFYRLNVFPIQVPPLRERRQDILPLVWTFVREFEVTMGKRIETLPRKRAEAVVAYPWPGNVRELRNVVERAMIVSRGSTLLVDVPALEASPPPPASTLEDVERRHILAILGATGWRVRGPQGAAARLGLKPTTLEARMARLGIKRGRSPSNQS
jgi:DNA-binding NtrC family response regulator